MAQGQLDKGGEASRAVASPRELCLPAFRVLVGGTQPVRHKKMVLATLRGTKNELQHLSLCLGGPQTTFPIAFGHLSPKQEETYQG